MPRPLRRLPRPPPLPPLSVAPLPSLYPPPSLRLLLLLPLCLALPAPPTPAPPALRCSIGPADLLCSRGAGLRLPLATNAAAYQRRTQESAWCCHRRAPPAEEHVGVTTLPWRPQQLPRLCLAVASAQQHGIDFSASVWTHAEAVAAAGAQGLQSSPATAAMLLLNCSGQVQQAAIETEAAADYQLRLTTDALAGQVAVGLWAADSGAALAVLFCHLDAAGLRSAMTDSAIDVGISATSTFQADTMLSHMRTTSCNATAPSPLLLTTTADDLPCLLTAACAAEALACDRNRSCKGNASSTTYRRLQACLSHSCGRSSVRAAVSVVESRPAQPQMFQQRRSLAVENAASPVMPTLWLTVVVSLAGGIAGLTFAVVLCLGCARGPQNNNGTVATEAQTSATALVVEAIEVADNFALTPEEKSATHKNPLFRGDEEAPEDEKQSSEGSSGSVVADLPHAPATDFAADNASDSLGNLPHDDGYEDLRQSTVSYTETPYSTANRKAKLSRDGTTISLPRDDSWHDWQNSPTNTTTTAALLGRTHTVWRDTPPVIATKLPAFPTVQSSPPQSQPPPQPQQPLERPATAPPGPSTAASHRNTLTKSGSLQRPSELAAPVPEWFKRSSIRKSSWTGMQDPDVPPTPAPRPSVDPVNHSRHSTLNPASRTSTVGGRSRSSTLNTDSRTPGLVDYLRQVSGSRRPLQISDSNESRPGRVTPLLSTASGSGPSQELSPPSPGVRTLSYNARRRSLYKADAIQEDVATQPSSSEPAEVCISPASMLATDRDMLDADFITPLPDDYNMVEVDEIVDEDAPYVRPNPFRRRANQQAAAESKSPPEQEEEEEEEEEELREAVPKRSVLELLALTEAAAAANTADGQEVVEDFDDVEELEGLADGFDMFEGGAEISGARLDGLQSVTVEIDLGRASDTPSKATVAPRKDSVGDDDDVFAPVETLVRDRMSPIDAPGSDTSVLRRKASTSMPDLSPAALAARRKSQEIFNAKKAKTLQHRAGSVTPIERGSIGSLRSSTLLPGTNMTLAELQVGGGLQRHSVTDAEDSDAEEEDEREGKAPDGDSALSYSLSSQPTTDAVTVSQQSFSISASRDSLLSAAQSQPQMQSVFQELLQAQRALPQLSPAEKSRSQSRSPRAGGGAASNAKQGKSATMLSKSPVGRNKGTNTLSASHGGFSSGTLSQELLAASYGSGGTIVRPRRPSSIASFDDVLGLSLPPPCTPVAVPTLIKGERLGTLNDSAWLTSPPSKPAPAYDEHGYVSLLTLQIAENEAEAEGGLRVAAVPGASSGAPEKVKTLTNKRVSVVLA